MARRTNTCSTPMRPAPRNKCPVCKAPPNKMKGAAVFTAGNRSLHLLNGPVILPRQRRAVCVPCLRMLHIIQLPKES